MLILIERNFPGEIIALGNCFLTTYPVILRLLFVWWNRITKWSPFHCSSSLGYVLRNYLITTTLLFSTRVGIGSTPA